MANDYKARMELVSDVLKAHSMVPPSKVCFFDEREVGDLLQDLHQAISDGCEQYYLGVVAVERGAKELSIVAGDRKRLAMIAILLDCIRHRLVEADQDCVAADSREMIQCINEFLDDLVKPLRKAARVKTLRRWQKFVEHHVCVAVVTAPPAAFMKVTRYLREENARR